jgi:NAD(P) transhydrogenase subunit alpha
MRLGVPRETYPGEQRVAVVPAVVPALAKAGLDVAVETGAGVRAGFPDAAFQDRGALIVGDRAALFHGADIVAQVHGPSANPDTGGIDLELARPGQILVGLMNPLGAPAAAERLAARGVTAFALELVPRISRAQSMDALSSMATIAGYKAVLLAAAALHKIFPLMMTAAGTITPARALVVGAGVAGLQAIATSRRLGAVVHAYDVRPAVKEQVESLGARFLDLGLDTRAAEGAGGYAQALGEEFYRRQRDLMTQAVVESDVVITTAAVPGERAPILITDDMVASMQPGAVIVDLAAETGGNCARTRAGETVEAHGVTVIGPTNLPSSVPYHASQLYARNVTAFVCHLVTGGAVRLDLDDEILRDTLLTRAGHVANPRVQPQLAGAGGGRTGDRRSAS